MNSKISDTILKVKNSLTEENWGKGSLFSVKNNKLYMCVHGAVQAQVNPVCKEVVENYENVKIDPFSDPRAPVVGGRSAARGAAALGLLAWRLLAPASARSGSLGASASFRTSNNLNGKLLSELKKVWNLRPDYVREDYIYNSVNYGNTEVHYFLGMVGLTPEYNDQDNSSFEDIQNKLQDAYELALKLGI